MVHQEVAHVVVADAAVVDEADLAVDRTVIGAVVVEVVKVVVGQEIYDSLQRVVISARG
jgi:hypothetical protein